MLPQINLRRVYLIARRDFLGYIKTWGFWISFLMPFIFGALAIIASQFDLDMDPVRYETILDDTGVHAQAIIDNENELWRDITDAIQNIPVVGNSKASKEAVQPKTIFVEPPSNDIEALKSYVKGEKLITIGEAQVRLNSATHIYEGPDGIEVDYWSTNISNQYAKGAVSNYFKKQAENDYLASGGLNSDGYADAKANAPVVKAFDPSKVDTGNQSGQAITDIDRIPYGVAAFASLLLWLTIFSGAYMLLTSMLEEKLNKLLEMMLATTRLSEIMLGKLLGIAVLTITAMLPYLLIGLAAAIMAALMGPPEMVAALANAITLKLLIFFPIFLVLGYVFYGALFIAMGAMAESMQDAQTITTPIVLVLTMCVMVVPIGFKSPDSPLIAFASWFPLSAPFAAIIRLPLDPPWWELALSASFLLVMSVGVIWLAGRIFQYGVLSGSGVKGITNWIGRVIFRRKARG